MTIGTEFFAAAIGVTLGIAAGIAAGVFLVLAALGVGVLVLNLAKAARYLPMALDRYACRAEIVSYYYRPDTHEIAYDITEPTPERVRLARKGKHAPHSLQARRRAKSAVVRDFWQRNKEAPH